jgi:hypothetical protein
MMLRQELNGILLFINEATLSDREWHDIKSKIASEDVDGLGENVGLKKKYQVLYGCVKERSGEGSSAQRLNGYFVAKGVIDSRVIDINVFDPRDYDPRVNDPRVNDTSGSTATGGNSGCRKYGLCNIMVGEVLE